MERHLLRLGRTASAAPAATLGVFQMNAKQVSAYGGGGGGVQTDERPRSRRLFRRRRERGRRPARGRRTALPRARAASRTAPSQRQARTTGTAAPKSPPPRAPPAPPPPCDRPTSTFLRHAAFRPSQGRGQHSIEPAAVQTRFTHFPTPPAAPSASLRFRLVFVLEKTATSRLHQARQPADPRPRTSRSTSSASSRRGRCGPCAAIRRRHPSAHPR